MKQISIITMLLIFSLTVNAQKYLTKNGQIKFYSESPAEKIEAVNKQVNSALDIASGEFAFKVLMKSFEFEKALMQEHFNENYVESGQFPNATFAGKVINLKEINFSKNGKYNATVEGNLTIHGVTKHITEKGTIEVTATGLVVHSVFNVLVADYGIKIPKAVMNNIAEKIQVTVDATLVEFKK